MIKPTACLAVQCQQEAQCKMLLPSTRTLALKVQKEPRREVSTSTTSTPVLICSSFISKCSLFVGRISAVKEMVHLSWEATGGGVAKHQINPQTQRAT